MKYRLVCFDLDGTILDDTEYIWYTLHRHFGVDMRQVRKWHRMFLEGRITYREWVSQDVKWWNEKGARKGDFYRAIAGLSLMPGAKEAISMLKRRNVKLAVVSGSLGFVLRHFFPANPFDYTYINEIFFDSHGRISGFRVTPYDMERKAAAVRDIARREGLDMCRTVFVGDNANDTEAVRAAGLGISFNSKSAEFDMAADVVLRRRDLTEVLAHII